MGPKGRVQKTSSAQTETMKRSDIDNGNEFDWSKTALDYALYRDIYPQSLYEMLHLFVTHESWTGRLRACRGVGASLEEEKVRAFSEEHMSMLIDESVPHEFHVPHQIVMYVYRVL